MRIGLNISLQPCLHAPLAIIRPLFFYLSPCVENNQSLLFQPFCTCTAFKQCQSVTGTQPLRDHKFRIHRETKYSYKYKYAYTLSVCLLLIGSQQTFTRTLLSRTTTSYLMNPSPMYYRHKSGRQISWACPRIFENHSFCHVHDFRESIRLGKVLHSAYETTQKESHESELLQKAATSHTLGWRARSASSVASRGSMAV